MLENHKKLNQNKMLSLLILTIPLSTYALSMSSFLNFLKNDPDAVPNIPAKQETIQSMKVFESNKIFTFNDDSLKINNKNIVSENSLAFDPHNEFTDDLDSGITENHSENAMYTVQKGDSINSIAAYFGVSVDTILTFNHMSSKTVKVGDVLEVPSMSGVLYEVNKGDTLAAISKKYSVDPEDVSLYNGLLSTDKLTVGDEIFLPGAKETNIIKKITNTKVGSSVNKFAKDATNTKSKNWAKGDTSHLNTPAAIAKNSSLPKYEGYYLFPAPGSTRTQKMHGNNGVDLANKVGSPVLATADGVVAVAKTGGYNFGYGNYIKVVHSNGTESIYAHLSKVNVTAGQSVTRGQTIGAVGSTGNSTGPHLHFEIHGAYNPFAW